MAMATAGVTAVGQEVTADTPAALGVTVVFLRPTRMFTRRVYLSRFDKICSMHGVNFYEVTIHTLSHLKCIIGWVPCVQIFRY